MSWCPILFLDNLASVCALCLPDWSFISTPLKRTNQYIRMYPSCSIIGSYVASPGLWNGYFHIPQTSRDLESCCGDLYRLHGQLRGLVPVIEDWHVLQCMQAIIFFSNFACCQTIRIILIFNVYTWIKFYRSNFKSDTETSHHMKNFDYFLSVT